MNIDLIKQVLLVAVGSSIIATPLLQKIKELIANKNIFKYVSVCVSILIGLTFALSFSDLAIIPAIWVGLITYAGADGIYKAFEDKIFKSYKELGISDEANSAQTDATKITFEKVGE